LLASSSASANRYFSAASAITFASAAFFNSISFFYWSCCTRGEAFGDGTATTGYLLKLYFFSKFLTHG